MLNRYPGSQLKLILRGSEIINSGQYGQFASVGKVADGFIEIPTGCSADSERAI
jgi:hypothetical protein